MLESVGRAGAARTPCVLGLLVATALGCAATHREAGVGALSAGQALPGRHAPAERVVAGPAAEGHRDETSTFLLLRLGEMRLYMVGYDRDSDAPPSAIESFPVAIGRAGWDTPTGVFAVTDKTADPDYVQFDWDDPSRVFGTIPPGPDNPLGRRWIGFASGHGWQIGLHGTPHPELLGHRVSHGCVRMRNEDVVKVYDRVRIGTVVIVQP